MNNPKSNCFVFLKELQEMQEVHKKHEKEVFGDKLEVKGEPVDVEIKENVDLEMYAALKIASASEVKIAPAAAVQ